jgi:stearoyl-CoA desaturase (delta-9 desaturase)
VGTSNLLPRRHGRVHAGKVTGLLVFHLTALLAPWTFTWPGLLTAAVLVLLTGQLGVGLGYHRLLCHRSFHTAPWLRYVLALLGVLAFQRGPLTWCAIHRLHHRYADGDRDPQMSHCGLHWAHLLWTVVGDPVGLTAERDIRAVTRDLHREPILCWLERHFAAVNALFALGLFLAGWLMGGVLLATSLLVWCFFLRVVYYWHVTFLVNSVSHRWGYRNYASPDNSRNCWWVALLSFGEGWHNNHHHRPRCAAHGHRWFEVDATYAVIRLLESLGLIRGVVHPPRQTPARMGGRRVCF